MKKTFVSMAIISLLSGCATPPAQMQDKYVSSRNYEDNTCEQINSEYSELHSRRVALRKELQSKAQNDAFQLTFGLIAFWPTLFFLEGGDGPMADEYTDIGGKMTALERVSFDKNCPVLSRIELEKTETKKKAKEGDANERCGMYQMCNQVSK